jgi:hypothetical protein
MAYWENVQGDDEDPQVTTGDFTDLRLTTNGAGITIFYGDADADIPKPPNADQLAELGAADGGQTPDDQGNTTTTTPDDESTTSTTAGEPSEATTTTAGESATTTSAP